MNQTQRARPGLAGSAGRAASTTTMTGSGPVSTTVPAYTTSATTTSPFLNTRGQTVGFLVTTANEVWLEKRVKRAKHFFHKWKAWCIDRAHLERLRAMGATGVRLVITDEGDDILEAPLSLFEEKGWPLNHDGHGEQVALAEERWQEPYAPKSQPSLFDLLEARA